MTIEGAAWPGALPSQQYGEPASLGDLLERVLDAGLVIAGDIRVNLLDIELLTIKLRLLVASVETARELGIDWWESDPWLTGSNPAQRRLAADNRRLRARLAALEGASSTDAAASSGSRDAMPRRNNG